MIKHYFLLPLVLLLFNFANGQSGTIDPSYANGDEIRTINFLEEEELISYSVTDSQDRTWIAGQTYVDGDWRIILTRLDAEGNYDESFGGTGYAVIELGASNNERIKGIALQNDNLFVAGVFLDNGVSTPFLISYSAEGSLNTDFGTFGAFVADVIDMDISGIYIDQSGSIYLTGAIENNVIVLKVEADGSDFDQDFGFFGATVADFPSVDRPVAIDMDAAGNIYVFGYGKLNDITRGHVTSFTPTGFKNTGFTANGRKSITWPDDKQFFVSDGLIHSSNQKIYLSGRTRNPNTGGLNTAAVAIDLNAQQDMNFGQNGWMETDLAIGGDDFSNAMEEGLNGLYLAVSIQESPNGSNSGILHIDETGARVESFGNLGVAKLNVIQAGADHGFSISFQSDDKVLLVGIAETNDEGIFGYATRLLNEVSTSSTEDIYLEEILLYPNPASDFLRVNVAKEGHLDLSYEVFD